jgi:hypothetical protein
VRLPATSHTPYPILKLRSHSLHSSPSLAHPQSSHPCLAPCARQGSTAAVHRGLTTVPPSLLSPRRFCCLGEFLLDVRDPGHPSIRPLHLYSLWPRSSDLPLCSRNAPTVDPNPHRAPSAAQGPQNLPTLYFSLPHSWLHAIAHRSEVASPLSHPTVDGYPLVPLHRCRAHARAIHTPPDLPEPSSLP